MGVKNFSGVRHVQRNEAVAAAVDGRPTRDLEQRTNYLRAVLDGIEAGQTLLLRDQALSADVLDGHAVAWDKTDQQFVPALATAETDSASGQLIVADSSDIIGIVVAKDSATAGTIAVGGVFQLTTAQLTNLTGSASPEAGRYYLSASAAGTVTQQRPPVTVMAGWLLAPVSCGEVGLFVLQARIADFLADHTHYQFQLTCRPAGTHVAPDPGGHHVITDGDSSLPGWLPADHEVFEGNAPVGAYFGYNLLAHNALRQLWPPVPVGAAVLELYRPTDLGPVLAGRVLPEHVRFDRNGIWWMTDCYGEVPWPDSLATPDSSSSSAESLGSESCPTSPRMRATLTFTRLTFGENGHVVTSLAPATGSPIAFVDCDGLPATTGDLFAQLNLAARYDDDEALGGQVLKSVLDDTLLFGRGWVAEGLVAGSDAVSLSGTRTRRLDPAAALSDENPLVHQGIVTVDVVIDPAARELPASLVRLGGALERDTDSVEYLGLPAGRTSYVRVRFELPTELALPTAPTMKIRALVLGTAVGPLSALTMYAAVLPRPTDGSPSDLTGVGGDVAFDVVTPSEDYNGLGDPLPALNVIEVDSEEFEITAGATVFVTIARASGALPALAGDVGLMRLNGIIQGG